MVTVTVATTSSHSK